MDISHMIETITPITLFNKGKASQLFAKAINGKPLLVVKNNAPVAVILSKDEYCRLYQLAHAIHREHTGAGAPNYWKNPFRT